jgi:LL-diaminopimelate aminotransferase
MMRIEEMTGPSPDPASHAEASVFSWLFELKERASARGVDLIDLGIGSPDMPAPAMITDDLAHAVRDPRHHGYPPFRGTAQFLLAASRYMNRRYGVTLDPATEIQCVSGAEEGFTHLAVAMLGPGRTCILGDIHYPIHRRAAALVGADTVLMPLRADRGFVPDLDAISPDVLASASLMIVNYPHNPTGATCDLAFFERAVALCRRHDILLVSDLAYSELTFDGYDAPSALQVEGSRDHVIEMHSFSKSFNMAGFRVAFAAGGARAIERLYRVRSNCTYGTPTAIQHAAAVALDHAAALVPTVVSVYQPRRNAVMEALRSIGYAADVPRATMFVWARVPDGYTSMQWAQRLIEEAGVVVTPGDAFGPGGAGWFRVSLVADADVLTDAVRRMGSLEPSWTPAP